MVKILATGDWHIGNFPGPEKNGENLRFLDICHCLDVLCDEAEGHKPDVILIAGDVFHQARVWSDRGLRESKTAIEYIRKLNMIAPVVVLRGTPNHDSFEQFKSLETVFENDRSVCIATMPKAIDIRTYTGKWVQVSCLPGFDRGLFRAAHPGLDKSEENAVFNEHIGTLIEGLVSHPRPSDDTPRVLLAHYTIDGADMESGQTAFFGNYEPCVFTSDLQAANFDLCCFGHIHKPQQIEGCKNTFYCGAVSALNFNDEGQKRGYYIHEISKPEYGESVVKSEFHELPSRKFLTIRLNDDDIGSINENGVDWTFRQSTFGLRDITEDKIIRVLYDCTDEHNKAFNHAVLENWLYKEGKAFYVQEITPRQISITVDKKSMEADNTPEDNLKDYLLANENTPDEIVEIMNIATPIIHEAMEKATTEHRTGLFVPVEIEVKNYRNYRDEKFSFDDIRFCTINGNNGVGKSSLFMDAMLDALFEETREGELTGWICNDPDVRSGSIKFTFGLGDSTYRVTRTRQKSGKATLNIAELVDGNWENRSKEKLKDTQAEIINIIGMDSMTLKACALIMQDQYGLFLQADKEARMNILGNILGLGIYADMKEIAAEKATEVNREIRTLEDKAAALSEGLPNELELRLRLAQAQKDYEETTEVVEGKRKELEDLQHRERNAAEVATNIVNLENRLETLNKSKDSKTAAKKVQEHVVIDANAILSQEDDIKGKIAEYEYLLGKKEEYDGILAELRALQEKRVIIQRTKSGVDRELTECGERGNAVKAALNETQEEIERVKQFEESHTIFEQKKSELEELEKLHPVYVEKMAQLNEKRRTHNDSTAQNLYKIKEAEIRIESLENLTKPLGNSGCIDEENACCKFLSAAIEAKKSLADAKADLEAKQREYDATFAETQRQLKEAEEAVADIIDLPSQIEARKKEINAVKQEAEEYAQMILLEAKEANYLLQLNEDVGIFNAKEKEQEDLTKELSGIEDEIAECVKRQKDLESVLSDFENCKALAEKEKELPFHREKKENAEVRIKELEAELIDIETDIAAIKTEILSEKEKTEDPKNLKEEIERAQTAFNAAVNGMGAMSMEIGSLKVQLEAAEEGSKKVGELQNKVNDLSVRATVYEELKKAFSQDGIPHNIIRSIIPVFEATATNILGQMSQGHMSVEFVTEKVLKSNNKKEVTALDIIVNDSQTGRLPYMSRSGGERVKAALSVILALAEIKSSKAGVQLGFLFIDEPPFLDAPGVQAYCDALEAIQARYSDLKVMAITHDPAMKSRFPQSVDVIKTEEGSKVIYE